MSAIQIHISHPKFRQRIPEPEFLVIAIKDRNKKNERRKFVET